ncbi:Meteorin-like protein, partial [Ophiophagus hannah]
MSHGSCENGRRPSKLSHPLRLASPTRSRRGGGGGGRHVGQWVRISGGSLLEQMGHGVGFVAHTSPPPGNERQRCGTDWISQPQHSWEDPRGNGLSQEAGSVEQISLHCAEGSLEWLYPAGALRLSLSPRLPTGPAGKEKPQHITACIKSSSSFRGAQIYLERDGVLELLLSETEAALQPKVRCFRWLPGEKAALFLQSTLHQDISRRIAAFRYELRGEWKAHFSWPWRNLSVEVIRGNIKSVSNDREAQESIIGVSATRIHRQKFALFQPVGKSGKSTGNIHTLLRCGVKPGPGSFLFTGWMHFAEAWLTCAPRYKDFIRIYEEARQAHENPCEV